MTLLILRGIRARKLRTILTSFAIVLGVAMISGTFVLTNQINGAFDDIFQEANAKTDAVVLPVEAFDTGGDEEVVPLSLDESLVQKVAAVPGVAAASGFRQDTAYLVHDGKIVKPSGAPAFLNTNVGERFETAEVLEGSLPRASGEVALDKALADREDLQPGAKVQIATANGLQDVVVSGIVKYPYSIGGATIIMSNLADSQAWMDQPGKVSTIIAAADPGISEPELANRIRDAVAAPGIEVKTGEQDAKDNADEINSDIGGFLTPALLSFGFVAVFVGAFIIFNTFMITVAQRVREFGMLRTLGASRSQLMRAVIGEALVIGIAASLIGLVGGFLVAAGINALFTAVGFGLPTNDPALTATAIEWSLVVGVGVTLVASIFPAWRATRISPIAALREGATLPRGRFARYSWVLSVIFALLGVLLIAQGFSGAGDASQRLLGMGFGALLVFIGVAMAAKYAVRPIARLVGWPIEGATGMTGRLARENAMRNPSRTAITSAALMIGLAIVVFVSVFAAGLKETIASTIKGSIQADVVVQSSDWSRVPGAIVPALKTAAGLRDVAGLYTERVRFDSQRAHALVGVDPVAFGEDWKFKWVDGSQSTLAQLGTNGGVLDKDTAETEGLGVGDSVTVSTQAGKSGTFQVKGIYDGSNTFLNGLVVPEAAFQSVSANREADVVLARADGVSPEAARDSAAKALEEFPVADVETASQFTQSSQDSLDPIIFLLYGLLLLIVIISLFGIIITLVLSILERTREIGMLRAIGTTRRQLRRMVRYESVITAIIGGLLGIVVGLFFGWVMAKGLESEGIQFAVPVGQVVASLIVAIIAGIISAVLPARRAAKLNVLEALQYE